MTTYEGKFFLREKESFTWPVFIFGVLRCFLEPIGSNCRVFLTRSHTYENHEERNHPFDHPHDDGAQCAWCLLRFRGLTASKKHIRAKSVWDTASTWGKLTNSVPSFFSKQRKKCTDANFITMLYCTSIFALPSPCNDPCGAIWFDTHFYLDHDFNGIDTSIW